MDLRRGRVIACPGLRFRPSASRCLILLWLLGASAGAQAGEANAPQPGLADGIDGLPGLHRLGVPGTAAPRLGGGLWLQYGYTEPQNGEPDGHHRLGGTAAAGGALWPYLAGAVRVDVRHDLHGDDPRGSDSGTLVDVTPILRAGIEVTPGLYLGGEGRLVFAGAAATQGVAPPTFDGRLQAAGRFGRETVALYGGYRTAQGGAITEDAEQLRPGDRVVLGVSEYGALLLGLGFMHSFEKADLLAELTWDVLVGDGAPSAAQSPLRLGVGARHWLVPALALQAMVEVSLGDRAPSTSADPLVPVEPRALALLGATVRLPDLVQRERPQGPASPPREEPPLPPPPPPPLSPPAALRVLVSDETGHPISDARVTIEVPAGEGQEPETIEVPLEQLNAYTATDLAAGEVDITVSAALLQTQSQHLVLEPGKTAEVQVKLAKEATQGAQLRGLVRDYSGAGIPASIRVLPGEFTASCSEQGEFVLDLEPGTYEVRITADGYQTQTRRLRVRKEGVTVLNADLQRSN